MKNTKKIRNMVANTAFALVILVLVAAVPLLQQPGHLAHAHLLGIVTQVDDYQVSFQQTPQAATAGQNTTLHFGVLQNNAPVGNVNMAVVIKEKESGKVVEQVPYKLHEISDITIPYAFPNNTDYVVNLLMRMDDGNKDHMVKPLTTDFDVSITPTSVIQPAELLMGALPFTAGLVGAVVVVFKKVK
jgi:hypothetical protein